MVPVEGERELRTPGSGFLREAGGVICVAGFPGDRRRGIYGDDSVMGMSLASLFIAKGFFFLVGEGQGEMVGS